MGQAASDIISYILEENKNCIEEKKKSNSYKSFKNIARLLDIIGKEKKFFCKSYSLKPAIATSYFHFRLVCL